MATKKLKKEKPLFQADNLKRTAKNLHDGALHVSDNLVDVSLAAGAKWQKIMTKALNQSTVIFGKQQDLLFSTLEEIKGQYKTGNKRFKKLVGTELPKAKKLKKAIKTEKAKIEKKAKSVVTINSTAGLSAVHHGKPVKCLGAAIFNFKGLTYQGTLNSFWKSSTKPNMDLYQKFRLYTIYTTQMNGNFYHPKGVRIATRAFKKKFTKL